MDTSTFHTEEGNHVPFVTEDQMRDVDRIAVEVFGLGILQMMENAGRNLALAAMDMLPDTDENVTILAGTGGNGGGGICCARHLHNHGYTVNLFLSKEPSALKGPAKSQLNILTKAGLRPIEKSFAGASLEQSNLMFDARFGYSLNGAPRG
ncbi:MAG: NAD(P)H-hydrate epimerase, partial [Chloroflexota bacterium]